MEKILKLMGAGIMRNAIGLIPTRLNSRRLPRKSLKMIGNLPLIIHTYKRAKLSKKLKEVFICCDSKEVYNIANKFGANVIITSKKHKCGTDRISEAFKKVKGNYDQIINIQGDEPLIDPKNIDKVINFHRKNLEYDIVLPNLITKFTKDPHVVRLIFNKKKEVIYITRSEAPNQFIKKTDKIFKHLSIVSFKPSALKKYSSSKQSGLELIEDIELLRAIENGMCLGSNKINSDSFSVDVINDYRKAKMYLKKDKIKKKYKN